MKNRDTVHAQQSAKIYRNNYKSSFNLFRLFKSILAVILGGSATASSHYYRRW